MHWTAAFEQVEQDTELSAAFPKVASSTTGLVIFDPAEGSGATFPGLQLSCSCSGGKAANTGTFPESRSWEGGRAANSNRATLLFQLIKELI